jgi:hypothetical protein
MLYTGAAHPQGVFLMSFMGLMDRFVLPVPAERYAAWKAERDHLAQENTGQQGSSTATVVSSG